MIHGPSKPGRIDGMLSARMGLPLFWTAVATVTNAIGLAWWRDGVVFASGDAGLGTDGDGVFRLDVDTLAVTLIGEIEGANFLTVTPWDTLLITDPFLDQVLEMADAGATSLWSDSVRTPNGTAFSMDEDQLWVVSSFDVPAPVWQVDVVDGTQNVAGTVDRVTPDGQTSVVADEVPVGETAP